MIWTSATAEAIEWVVVAATRPQWALSPGGPRRLLVADGRGGEIRCECGRDGGAARGRARGGGAGVHQHGSSSEYGLKDHAPREDEWLEPNSHYAVTKAAGTHLTALAAAEGLPAVTLRLYSIYGPWEDLGRLDTGTGA